MRVRTISPRGYCYGVVDAMVLVRRVAANPDVPRPIHVLGMLVHNRRVTEAFEEIGVVCIDGKGAADLSSWSRWNRAPSCLRRMASLRTFAWRRWRRGCTLRMPPVRT